MAQAKAGERIEAEAVVLNQEQKGEGDTDAKRHIGLGKNRKKIAL